MAAPTQHIGEFHEEADDPVAHGHGDGGVQGVDTTVEVVVANVHVAVEAGS